MVDQGDKVITSVEKPVLSQVIPKFDDDNKFLCLNAPGMDTLRVPIHQNTQEFKVLRYLTIRLRARVSMSEYSQRGLFELTIAPRKRGRVV